jgi:hypothetical protein
MKNCPLFSRNSTVVDLSGLMVGVYWMVLELGDGRQVVKKLVKR